MKIERRLAPLYQRLRLPEGRLELMSGIQAAPCLGTGNPPQRPQHPQWPGGDRGGGNRPQQNRVLDPRQCLS